MDDCKTIIFLTGCHFPLAFCFAVWYRTEHPWGTCLLNNWWVLLGCICGGWMACWGMLLLNCVLSVILPFILEGFPSCNSLHVSSLFNNLKLLFPNKGSLMAAYTDIILLVKLDNPYIANLTFLLWWI